MEFLENMIAVNLSNSLLKVNDHLATAYVRKKWAVLPLKPIIFHSTVCHFTAANVWDIMYVIPLKYSIASMQKRTKRNLLYYILFRASVKYSKT